MEKTLFVLAAFLISAFVGGLTIPRIVLISKKKKLFDALTERKSHLGDIPRLGGLAFLPAFIVSLSFTLGLRYYLGYLVPAAFELTLFKELMFLLAGMTILFLVGLSDDLTEVSYKTKFLAQLLAACLLLYAGLGINNLGGLFGVYQIPTLLGAVLTVMLVVMLCNAYNLIDGIDGLCSGLSLLALGTFGGWFFYQQLYVYTMIAFALTGVLTTFFFFNIMGKRLKIFMGDTGSLLLGYMIAFLGLKFYNLNIDSSYFHMVATPAVCLGIVFIPTFDTLRVFCVRMAAGRSPFYPDRLHIHHKVLALGFTHLQSTAVIVNLQALFIGLNLALRNLEINLLLAINILLGMLLIGGLNHLGRRRNQHLPQGKKLHPIKNN